MSITHELDGLLSNLSTVVEEALAYFEGPGSTATTRVGDWGSREVLCHFLFWHEITAAGMESATSGGGPRILNAQVNELNEQAITQYTDEGIPQLAARARDLQERLVRAARQLPSLDIAITQRHDGSQATARERLELVSRHWQAHIAGLQT